MQKNLINMQPKKSLGQNFLSDSKILNQIVDEAEVRSDDIIIEIGPGTGNLTKKIIERNPSEIILVEKDYKLSNDLRNKFGDNVKIINKDILECYHNFKFNKPIKVFGNLPYNISTKILISFLKIDNLENYFSKFIFVFQKEVADRIVANVNSKNYGRLSVLTSWRMNSSKIFDISPEFFYPIPKVWSTLITLSPISNYEKIKKIKNLEHITSIFFNQRRKMIGKPMKQLFLNYKKISENLDLDLKLRPQNISIKKYLEICKIYENLNQ